MKMWEAFPRPRAAGTFVLELEYPIQPRPRYGYGPPAHAGLLARIAGGRAAYGSLLSKIAAFAPALHRIPSTASDDLASPRWENGFYPPVDAVTLYGLLALRRPRLYVEIGSGESTRFARRAIADFGLSTRIVSIDPSPRAEIDALCDEVIRTAFEDARLDLFSELRAGDMVFHDGSHRVFQNSDTVVTFLDVLPALAPGVILGVHDIYLPWDYPPEWAERYYSEQYVLAAYLLADCPWLRVLLPNHFITHDEELLGALAPVWSAPGLAGRPLHGEGFWLEVQARGPAKP
jgi:Methyltransferase domain